MTKPLSIFYPDHAYSYAKWLGLSPAPTLESADCLGLSGGSDVNSSRYGKRSHPTSYASPYRDEEEFSAVERARKLGMPIIGTCRGHQVLTVAAGGLLVQDMCHPGTHEIETEDGKRLLVCSLHHQLVYPWNMPKEDYRVIGWANALSPYHYGESDADDMTPPGGREPEIIYLPKLKALSWQTHPEMMSYREESARARASLDYMRGLFSRLIAGTL